MFTWPATLPAPLWDGYSTTQVDVVERTPTDDGKFRSRPRAKRAPTLVDLAVVLDAEQETLAHSFHDYVLHMGTDSFLMRLRSGGQMRAMTVQFVNVPVFSQLGPNRVRMGMRLIVHSDFGAVLWCDTDLSKGIWTAHVGADIALGTLDDFKVSRVYVFGREAFNGGDDKFILGWSGDTDALVELTAFPAADAILTLTAPSGTSGVSLGVGQTSSRTINFRFQADAEPTTGAAVIVVPYDDYTAP